MLSNHPETIHLTSWSMEKLSSTKPITGAKMVGDHCPTEFITLQFSSVAQSCLTLCDPMNCSTAGLPVHHQLPEFTQTHVHRVGDAISSSVVPFSSRLQSFPASGSFQMSQFFTWDGQNTGVSASASVLPMNTQDWSPLWLLDDHILQSRSRATDAGKKCRMPRQA